MTKSITKYFIGGSVVFFIAFLFVPLIMSILISFDARGYAAYIPGQEGFSLRQFRFFFGYQKYVSGLVTSAYLGIMATVCSVTLGLACSLGIVRSDFKGKDVLQTIFLSPLVVPGVITGTGMLLLFGMMNFRFTLLNLLVAHVIITLPYVLKVLIASLIGFDMSMEEASNILGASQLQTFRRITLPLIRPGLLAAAVFAFAMSFEDVATSVFLTDSKVYTFPVVLLSALRSSFNPSIAVSSVISISLTLALMLIIEKAIGLDKFAGVFES